MSQNSEPRATPEEEEPIHFNVVDRRVFTDPGSLSLEAVEEPKPRYPTFVEELMGRVAETERRFEEKKKEMQEEIARIRTRLQSDFDRRVETEKRGVLEPFLEILDNLERALQVSDAGGDFQGLRGGVEMTAGLFRQRLQAWGIEAISVLDRPYDPNVAEAIGMTPVDDPARDGMVVEEVLRGYRMGERLIRPARVRVGQFRQ